MSLDEILHDLDHQKFEAIGVETLAKQIKPVMSALILILSTAETSNAQDLAVLKMLADILQDRCCIRCLELIYRIKIQFKRDFQEFLSR